MGIGFVTKAWMAALVCTGTVASAASNFTVSPGNWVVTDEVNGLPGRGMGIEVRDGTLVMAVYNYTASGKATFHLTAGALNNNRFTGQLIEYKGGRYLGGPALDATQTGSAGEVKINFSGATTGTIQFPGEQAVNISRYVFDGVPQGRFLQPNYGEVWILTKHPGQSSPEAGIFTVNEADGRVWSDAGDCQMDSSTSTVNCMMQWDATTTAKVALKRYGQRVEGTLSEGSSSYKERVVGARLGLVRFRGDDTEMFFDTANQDWIDKPPTTSTVPEAGLWIISAENTGKPGRGLTLDLQMNTLVMQLYGYEADGSPTFRIGSGRYRAGAASVALQKVTGGRHYGSGALSGTSAGSDGNAQIRFTSPTEGMIMLPGEQWVAMQKFSVGQVAPQPESLLGKWMFYLPGAGFNREYTVLNLTSVENGKAKGSGSKEQCWYETTPQGTVRCTDFWGEFRFYPAYNDGVSMGWAMDTHVNGTLVEDGDHIRITMQRIIDRQGVVSGSLNK